MVHEIYSNVARNMLSTMSGTKFYHAQQHTNIALVSSYEGLKKEMCMHFSFIDKLKIIALVSSYEGLKKEMCMHFSFIDKLIIFALVSSHHGFNERHTLSALLRSTSATSLCI